MVVQRSFFQRRTFLVVGSIAALIGLYSLISFGVINDLFTQECEFNVTSDTFPDDFLFGTSTSAYQIEGAWDEDGKGVSIWDALVHDDPDLVKDKSNCDECADSYHHYKDDIQLIKQIGVSLCISSRSQVESIPMRSVTSHSEIALHNQFQLNKYLSRSYTHRTLIHLFPV